MKTGYVNLVAGTLALVFAVLWALQSPDITAVFAIIASFFWIGFGLFNWLPQTEWSRIPSAPLRVDSSAQSWIGSDAVPA